MKKTKAMDTLPTPHKKKKNNNNHKTQDWKPILNRPRSTFQLLEQMMKPKDSSHNLKMNFLNKHLKPKEATTNASKWRACNKNWEAMTIWEQSQPTRPTPCRTVSKSNFCKWAKGRLTKNAKEASREKLAEVKEQALQLLHNKVELGIFSEKEESFTKQTVESNTMSPPKRLTKDHKNPNEGHFPTRLAVLATNFTSAFPKTDQMGIKRITDNTEANQMSKTMIQASSLKKKPRTKEQLATIQRQCQQMLKISANWQDQTGEKISLSLLQLKNCQKKIKSSLNTSWT